MKTLLSGLLCMLTVSLSYAQMEKRPIRLALGYVSTLDLDEQSEARLRRYIQSAITQKIRRCNQLEFVPENLEAFKYYKYQDFKFTDKFKQPEKEIPIPSEASYVVSVGFSANREYGGLLTLEVSRVSESTIQYLTDGSVESDYVLSKLKEPTRLKAFAEKAVDATLTDNIFRNWLREEGIHSSKLVHCFLPETREGNSGSPPLMYDFAVSCPRAAKIKIDGNPVYMRINDLDQGYFQFDIEPGFHTITIWDKDNEIMIDDEPINVNQDCLTLRGCNKGAIYVGRAPGCEETEKD